MGGKMINDDLKTLREDFLIAQKYLLSADSWDEELFDYFDGDEAFNGNAKELNQGVSRGIYLYLNEPKNYEFYNEGWTMGCGYSIRSLVEYLSRRVEK
tara:strand:+ start:198 stop:491 length:294 start_codon:yes stop_codon:yes gene_type:complete